MSARPHRTRVPSWRAHVAAVELVGAAVLAHAAADGGFPGPEALLPVTLVALGLTQAVRHRLLRPAAATLLAGAAQVGLHVLLTAVPTGSTGHAAGHAAGHSVLDPSWVTGDMLLAHAVAAALTLLTLQWQEQVVADLRGLLRGRVADVAPLPELHTWVRRVTPSVRTSHSFITVAPRRGPPLTSLATG
jgi:hypothetical protein